MKKGIVLTAALIMSLPSVIHAGSLQNKDTTPYRCAIRDSMGVNEQQVYPESTVYFDCEYGCEIKLIETGQTIKLESDADVVIDDGELSVQQ